MTFVEAKVNEFKQSVKHLISAANIMSKYVFSKNTKVDEMLNNYKEQRSQVEQAMQRLVRNSA